MTVTTAAWVAAAVLGVGAGWTRLAAVTEARAVAVAHAGLALAVAIAGALLGPGADARAATAGGEAALLGPALTMLVPLAALAFALTLAIPERAAAPATLAAPLWVVAMAMACLVATSPAALLATEAGLVLATIAVAPAQARRALAVVRGGGLALVALGLASAPGEVALSPLPLAPGALGPSDAALIAVGSALLAGVGPGALAGRAAFCRGVDAAAVIAALPLAGMATWLHLAAPALAGLAARPAGVVTPYAAAACLAALALVAAALVLIQRSAGAALALLWSASTALALLGMADPDGRAALGGELLWATTLLAGGGLGAAMVALRERHGRLLLGRWNGYFDASPRLGILTLGFAAMLGALPGTLGFDGLELVLHGEVSGLGLPLGLAVCSLAIIGIGAMRMAFQLLYGTAPTEADGHEMPLRPREQAALGLLAALVLVAGLVPTVVPSVRAAASGGVRTVSQR